MKREKKTKENRSIIGSLLKKKVLKENKYKSKRKKKHRKRTQKIKNNRKRIDWIEIEQKGEAERREWQEKRKQRIADLKGKQQGRPENMWINREGENRKGTRKKSWKGQKGGWKTAGNKENKLV